jgi:hypothetical protein
MPERIAFALRAGPGPGAVGGAVRPGLSVGIVKLYAGE